MNALHINGNDLTLEAVREVAHERRPVLLAPDARELVNHARAVVDEIVATNKVAYAITTGVGKLSDVRIAADLAGELPRLTDLRAGLRERMRLSPLTDARGFARAIEQAYRNMWRMWCAGRCHP